MRILVIHRDAELRSALCEVLRGAGHDVEGSSDSTAETAGRDAIVADVDLAVSAAWFEATTRRNAKPRIVLLSAFDALLAPWREAGIVTVQTPANDHELLAALEGTSPKRDTAPFDWQAAERRFPSAREEIANALEANDDIVELVAVATGAPVVLVNVVGDVGQSFVAHRGLDDDLRIAAGTPRAWSFCQHVVERGIPLVVGDARLHPTLASNPFVQMGLVRGYAGFPLRSTAGDVIGTVCAVYDQTRNFAPGELASIRLAVRAIETKLATRSSAHNSNNGLDAATLRGDTPVDHEERAQQTDPKAFVGAPLGEYYVTAHLGSGGESHVYLARHRALGNLVVVKVLRDPRVGERLLAEGKALASVRHPNIVQVLGFGRGARGESYLVLEYVRGPSLFEHVRAARARGVHLSNDEVLKWTRQIGGALETLHAAGFAHGDVKPRNVVVDPSLDRAVLIDFGLAMRLPTGSRSTSGQWQAWRQEDHRVGGTPGYSAPEQMEHDAPAASTALDVYALGSFAYHLLVGHGPFAFATDDPRIPTERASAYRAASSVRPHLPPAVDALFASALSDDPKRRPRSPIAFVDALADALGGGSSHVAGRDEARSAGVTFTRIRRAGRIVLGEAKEEAAFESLPIRDRQIFLAADPEGWCPADPLIAYLRALEAYVPLPSLGAAMVRLLAPSLLASMNIDRAPHTLVRALSPILERVHDWIAISVRPLGTHVAGVELRYPMRFAPTSCAYFGGVVEAQVRSVRREVTLEHIRCMAQGASHCALSVRWRD